MEAGSSSVHKLNYRSAPRSSALSSRVLFHSEGGTVVYLLPPAPRGREFARLLATVVIALFPIVGLYIELKSVWRMAPMFTPAHWISEGIICLLLLGWLALLPVCSLIRGYRQGLIFDLDDEQLRLTIYGRFANRTHAWPRRQIRDMSVHIPRLRLFAPRATLRIELADRRQRVALVYHDPRHDLPAIVDLLVREIRGRGE